MSISTKTRTALDAFVARKAEIDRLLAKLQSMSDDHFDVAPDNVHWGHVGDLMNIAALLRRAVAEQGANEEG